MKPRNPDDGLHKFRDATCVKCGKARRAAGKSPLTEACPETIPVEKRKKTTAS